MDGRLGFKLVRAGDLGPAINQLPFFKNLSRVGPVFPAGKIISNLIHVMKCQWQQNFSWYFRKLKG